MLLTISEVRGWQNQEKTAGGMCCEPVRVRERRSLFLFLYRLDKIDELFTQKHWLNSEQKKEKSSATKKMD